MRYHWIAAFENGDVLRQLDNGQETSYAEVEKKAAREKLVRLSLVPSSPLHKGVFSVDLETGGFFAQGIWIPVKAPGDLGVVYFQRRLLELKNDNPREKNLYYLGWQCSQSAHRLALRIDPLRQLWCLTMDF